MSSACYNEVRDRSILRIGGDLWVLTMRQRCEMIWDAYVCAKEGQRHVIRRGFGDYGIYDYYQAINLAVRPESDAEHVYGCGILVDLVAMHFPKLIPPEEAFLSRLVMDVHDIGENGDGDIVDDGNRDEALKNQRELQAIKRYSSFLPEKNAANLVAFYKEFQERSTRRGRVLFSIDKGETVDQGLLFEAAGHGGDIRNKVRYRELSEQDRRNMETTGATDLVDIWAAHFLEVTRGMEEAAVMKMVMRVGVEKVRGVWFPWAEKYDVT